MGTKSPAKIGVSTATIVGMNAMIGSGIFAAPIALASGAGPAGILAYLFVLPAVWLMALSIARLAELYPQEGSFYTYTRQWGGHTMGMVAIVSYFIGLLIAMGLLAQMAGQVLHDFFPAYSGWTYGLLALWGLVALNIFGVHLSSLGQRILIVCTVFPLVTSTILCFINADVSNLFPFAPHGYLEVLKVTRVVIFGFFGFECAASLFNIVAQPHKNVPRALAYSITIVGILYVLFVLSLILAIPQELLSQGNITLPEMLTLRFPDKPLLVSIINVSVLSAILGTIHSMIWSSSHLLSLIARKVNSKTTIPSSVAVLLVGSCITLSYLLLKNMDLFFSLTAIFLVFAYSTSMITLLTRESEWRSGQNVKTILGLLTAAVILIFATEGLYHALM